MSAVLLAALLLAGPADTFTVTGSFEYRDKEWNWNGWTGLDPVRPVRRADVHVKNADTGKVLGRGVTGADGSFTIEAKSVGVVDVVVTASASTRLHKKLAGPFERIRVQTEAGTTWTVSTPTWLSHDTSVDLDVGTTTAEPVPYGIDEGNPFNVFDMAVAAWEMLADPAIGAKPRRSVKLYWPAMQGSYAWKRKAWIGADDGYDDAIILHEVGHLVHNVYSDSDSPGGIHYFGDSDQDPRLSMGEGYATFFAGAVLDALGREGMYVDMNGAVQAGGVQLRLRLETAAPYGASQGAADEVAVACTLFDLVDDELTADATPGVDDDGFVSTTLVNGAGIDNAWWQVFRKPVRKARRLTLNHAWDGWLDVHEADDHFADLQAAFDARAIRFWSDPAEPNNDQATALPLAPGAWSTEQTLYFADGPEMSPGTGDEDWIAFDVVAGQAVTVETRYPNGAANARTQVDPWLALYSPSGKKKATDDDGGTGRNARIADFVAEESGTWAAQVKSKNRTNRYGRYQVRVDIAGP